jgi:hypothetical protein
MGARGRPCKLCTSPELSRRVAALVASGMSYPEIATATDCNRHAIGRHVRHSRLVPVVETENLSEVELSEKRLATLSFRLEAQYAAALACADSKVALDITKVLARVETERHHRIVARKQAESETEADPEKRGAPSSEWLDMTVRKVRESRARDLQNGYVVCPICSFGRVHPKHIVERLQLLKAENNEHSGNRN